MSARRKYTETETQELLSTFYSNKGVITIGKTYHIDPHRTLRRIWLENGITLVDLKNRHKRLARLNKIGALNPMFGKCGLKHHNAKAKSKAGRYSEVFAPDWYIGNTDSGKALEHIIKYCEYHNLTEVPKGYVIHHRDNNPHNQDFLNLVMLSIGDHLRYHNMKLT